jgi:tetratricopeptide (TPR) repeat protein
MGRKQRRTPKSANPDSANGSGRHVQHIFVSALQHHNNGQLVEAEKLYRQVLDLEPNHFYSIHMLGVIAFVTWRYDLAVEQMEKAISINGDVPYCHTDLGNALRELGRLDEAIACHRRALEIKPDYAEAYNNLGNALRDQGRLDEALAAYEQAIAMNPRAASAWYNRTEHKRFTAEDPDIERMQNLLGPNGVESDHSRMLLHFALGKAYLDFGASEPAFHHLGEGNRLRRSTFSYSADSDEALTKSIARTFTPELFERFECAGTPSTLPVFVVGFPRSGTTLVEQILASHPMVRGAGELTALQQIVAGMGVYPDFMARLSADDITRMAGVYLAHIEPMAAGRRHVVDKLPANFQFAGLIRLMLPGARIIHCRRDPVDTCLSCYTKMFSNKQLFAYDMTELGRFHRDYQFLMAHWRSVLPASHFLEVDYERIVEDLEGEARRMIDFLNLPWDDSCLKFHEHSRPVLTASTCQVRKPIYKTSVGRWKAHARQLKPLLAALGIDDTATLPP